MGQTDVMFWPLVWHALQCFTIGGPLCKHLMIHSLGKYLRHLNTWSDHFPLCPLSGINTIFLHICPMCPSSVVTGRADMVVVKGVVQNQNHFAHIKKICWLKLPRVFLWRESLSRQIIIIKTQRTKDFLHPSKGKSYPDNLHLISVLSAWFCNVLPLHIIVVRYNICCSTSMHHCTRKVRASCFLPSAWSCWKPSCRQPASSMLWCSGGGRTAGSLVGTEL